MRRIPLCRLVKSLSEASGLCQPRPILTLSALCLRSSRRRQEENDRIGLEWIGFYLLQSGLKPATHCRRISGTVRRERESAPYNAADNLFAVGCCQCCVLADLAGQCQCGHL